MAESGVIVLAVYRPNPTLLQRQLRSIVDQSLTEWRCLVGIDGPDEAAANLVREGIQEDARFDILTFPENVGVYRHFERLLTLVDAKAPWIALADQDDYWYLNKLESLVHTLQNQRTSGASCQARLVTHTGHVLGITARTGKPLASLLLSNEVTGSLSILKHEVLELAMPFPSSSPSGIHDHWLGVCATALRGFYFSDEVLQDYVQHPDNVIGEKNQSILLALARLISGAVPLTKLTTDPWEWRVSMARTIGRRTNPAEATAIAAISHGRFTVRLLRLLVGRTWTRQIPISFAIAFSLAAASRRALRPASVRGGV